MTSRDRTTRSTLSNPPVTEHRPARPGALLHQRAMFLATRRGAK